MRTRLSVCLRKKRYRTEVEALEIVFRAAYPLRPYRCDRCGHIHLTGRTKGKKNPRFPADAVPAEQ